MLHQHLVDATGMLALSLNLGALVSSRDRTLLRTNGWASALWAVNNLLMGALTAASLSALSVGRQVTAAALLERPGRLKAAAFALLVVATLFITGLTWSGIDSFFPAAGSLAGTYAMFYLRGAALRWALVLVNVLWMSNAVAYEAWWQVAANGLGGGAAALGAWRARRG